MNILIIGVSGYVGQYLLNELIRDAKHFVTGISRSTMEECYSKNYLHVQADITREEWREQIIGQIDVVLYLAQSNQYRGFPSGTSDVFNVNASSVLEVLEWSQKNQVKKFIYASTGNVYKSKNSAIDESDVCEPNTFYGASKLCGELLCKQFSSFFDVYILRIFGVYGPDQKNMMFPNIIDAVRNSEKIILAKGKGVLVTPLYITDLLNVLVQIIARSVSGLLEVLNVSGDEIISLGQLTKDVSKLLNIKPKITIINQEPLCLIASNEKIKRVLQFEPQISYNEGLALTLT